MFTPNIRAAVVCFVFSMAIVPAARAQWAVIDVPAIAQLVQEVQTMQEQLTTAREQLQSAQQALQSTTGDRGMQGLLGGTTRNYLPSNWTQGTNTLRGQGSNEFAGLAADVQSAMAANAVLSPQ